MWKAVLAGAFALAAAGASSAMAQGVNSSEQPRVVSESGFVLTEAHIARVKAALRLTPAQQEYWPAVEAALHSFIHHRAREDGSGPQRVMAAAEPLIRVLDENQKQHALMFARALGIGSFASAY